MRTQPPRWLAVCVCTHAVMQDRHFNLVSCTPSDLTTRPTTDDAHYLESGISTRRQMGIRGGHCSFIDSSHFSVTHGGGILGLRTLLTTNTRGDRGLVA